MGFGAFRPTTMDLELLVVRRRSGINEDPDASKQRIYPSSAFSLTSVMVYLRHFEDYCNNQAPVNLKLFARS